jgi:hypothetical protein
MTKIGQKQKIPKSTFERRRAPFGHFGCAILMKWPKGARPRSKVEMLLFETENGRAKNPLFFLQDE